MNLYKYHTNPETLHRHDEAEDIVPSLVKDAINDAYHNYTNTLTPGQIKTIRKDPTLSFLYATRIEKGPWPPGEKAISTSSNFSIKYAMKVVNGKFPAGEKAIATDSTAAFNYAWHILKGRFPAGEKAIASNIVTAYQYAVHTIKDRWIPAESIILNTAILAYDQTLTSPPTMSNVANVAKARHILIQYDDFLKEKGYGDDILLSKYEKNKKS